MNSDVSLIRSLLQLLHFVLQILQLLQFLIMFVHFIFESLQLLFLSVFRIFECCFDSSKDLGLEVLHLYCNAFSDVLYNTEIIDPVAPSS